MFRNLSSIKYFFSSIINSFFSKIAETWGALIKKINTYVRDISSNLKNLLKEMLKKPKCKADYVKIGFRYFSKKFLFIGSLIFVILIYGTIAFAYPWAQGKLWAANLQYGSDKYSAFTGKVKVYDNGKLIYEGNMQDGFLSGEGKQYDENGILIYKGSFENNDYSGTGQVYYNEILIYDGSFLKSLYDGEGKLYNRSGKLLYNGHFTAGQRSGNGIEYDPEKEIRTYLGEFANDLKEGKGIVFDEYGKEAIYKGDFVAGLYEGTGKLYENAKLKYDGEFKSGLYEGSGKLCDINTGNVIYKGDFVAGKYEGSGELYDPKTKRLMYKGDFAEGLRSGKGQSYDNLGSITYDGEFSDDTLAYLNYIGNSFDDISKEFGKETYRKEIDDKLIITYLNKNMSMIFISDQDAEGYICDRVVVSSKSSFKGISKYSTQSQIYSIMGTPYSSIKFKFSKFYDTVFENLSINLKSSNLAPSDKFIMDGYAVRFYYNSDKTEILCYEVCAV